MCSNWVQRGSTGYAQGRYTIVVTLSILCIFILTPAPPKHYLHSNTISDNLSSKISKISFYTYSQNPQISNLQFVIYLTFFLSVVSWTNPVFFSLKSFPAYVALFKFLCYVFHSLVTFHFLNYWNYQCLFFPWLFSLHEFASVTLTTNQNPYYAWWPEDGCRTPHNSLQKWLTPGC